MKTLWFLISALLLWALPAQATTFWTDNFENHLYPNWIVSANCLALSPSNLDATGCNPTLTTAESFSPTHTLWSHYPNGAVQSGTYIDRTHTPTRNVWMRWRYKVAPGWITNTVAGSKQMYNKSTGGGELFWHLFPNDPNNISVQVIIGANRLCPNGTFTDGCNYYHNLASVNINDAQWHCIETHADRGTQNVANGSLDVFTDGIQTLHYGNLLMDVVGSSFDYITHYAQWGQGDRYIDDLVVADARIGGTGCNGGTSDTTPPSVVSGLTAVENNGSATLSWQPSVDTTGGSGLAGYNIRRCTGAACTPATTLTTVGNVTSYIDPTVSPSTTYGYAMASTDNAGNISIYSNPVYVTMGAGGTGLSLDAVSNSAVNTTAANVSWSHTMGGANNRFLLVCAQSRGTVQANVAVSSVTAGGVALAKIRSDENATDGTLWIRTELWQLVAPAPGTQTVKITWAGIPSTYGVGTAISFFGVGQSIPIDAQAGGTGNGSTLSAVVTTVADNAWIADCALSKQNAGLTVGANQAVRANRIVSAAQDGVGSSTVNAKTPAGAETMDWTTAGGTEYWALSAISIQPVPPAVPPRIATATVDLTGATLTYGATTPTSIRVSTDFTNVVYPISSFPGGRFTQTWTAGTTFVCFAALDVNGVENTTPADIQCKVPPPVATDTNPPVMSNGLPTATLPAGTTSTTISLTVDKPSQCSYDTTDIAYANMANVMSVASLTASATVSGLTNGSTTTYYARCQFTDTVDVVHPNLTSLVITVTVASSTSDTTPPSTVTNLTATALIGSQVYLQWGTATDNDTIIVNDNFNRADNADVGASWDAGYTGQNAAKIQGNEVLGTVQAAQSSETNSAAVGNDQSGTITLSEWSYARANARVVGVLLRVPAPPTYTGYTCTGGAGWDVVGSHTRIKKMSVGTLASEDGTVPWTIGDTLTCSVRGTTITAYRNGTPVLTATDSANTSGRVGFLLASDDATLASIALDNFVGSTLGTTVAGYQIFSCVGVGCTPTTLTGLTTSATTSYVVATPPGQSMTFCVKAIDGSNNLSAACSANATVHTTSLLDITPPTNMTNLRLVAAYTLSVFLAWDQGADTQGAVFSTIEQCEGAVCTNFATIQSQIAGTSLFTTLQPNTIYKFRGFNTDAVGNVSTSYSNVITVTTAATGLGYPAVELDFGSFRPTAVLRAPIVYDRAPRL
jgi:hypothetical protein